MCNLFDIENLFTSLETVVGRPVSIDLEKQMHFKDLIYKCDKHTKHPDEKNDSICRRA